MTDVPRSFLDFPFLAETDVGDSDEDPRRSERGREPEMGVPLEGARRRNSKGRKGPRKPRDAGWRRGFGAGAEQGQDLFAAC